MLKLKFYNDINKLENWLNDEADKGNICLKARPNYYLFHFEKIDYQNKEDNRYLVEKSSFIKEENMNQYIQASEDLGLSLVNVIPKDGILIFKGRQNTVNENISRKRDGLSLIPMYLKSIFANTLATFASFLAITHLETNSTVSTIIICIGSLSFISMATSYISLATDLLKKEKIVLTYEQAKK